MRGAFARAAMGVAVWAFVVCGGAAAEVGIDLGGEVAVEYLSGLDYDHDYDRLTPPQFVKDWRYSYEVSAGAWLEAGDIGGEPVRFATRYSYDQRRYEEFHVLLRNRHTADASVQFAPGAGRNLFLRGRYRHSQPEGFVGDIESFSLLSTLRFRESPWGVAGWTFRPFVEGEWFTADFRKVDVLDGDGWSAMIASEFMNEGLPLTIEVSSIYGERVAEIDPFTNEYAKGEVEFTFPANAIWGLGWLPRFHTDLSFWYRETWFEGESADNGEHRRDREYGSVIEFTRPIGDYFGLGVRLELEDHESNWENRDYLESSAKVYWEANF